MSRTTEKYIKNFYKLGDSFEGLLKNNNLYNDKELFVDGDLNWYDYGLRNYDPQIGRFVLIDPLCDDYVDLTPYYYALNDPIGNVDEDGLAGVGVLGLVACWSGQSAAIYSVLPEIGPSENHGQENSILVNNNMGVY